MLLKIPRHITAKNADIDSIEKGILDGCNNIIVAQHAVTKAKILLKLIDSLKKNTANKEVIIESIETITLVSVIFILEIA